MQSSSFLYRDILCIDFCYSVFGKLPVAFTPLLEMLLLIDLILFLLIDEESINRLTSLVVFTVVFSLECTW